MAHSESCKKCKTIFLRALRMEFGKVTEQWKSGWPCKLEDVVSLPMIDRSAAKKLAAIHHTLQNYRGHQTLVKKPKLQPCDYYVETLNCLVEFDESQHFTRPRGITLKLYPGTRKLAFSKNEWRDRCRSIDRHDNRPAYRDEQRAWFDTLRDLLPSYSGMNPTVRIWAKEMVWCEQSIGTIRRLLRQRFFTHETVKTRERAMKKNYKKTVVDHHKEYIGRKLLLANTKKTGLYRCAGPEKHLIEISFDDNGLLSVCKVDEKFKRIEQQTSLRALGRDCLGLEDPSVPQMLKFLVTPEMEVERIFNCLRYKYLDKLKLTNSPGDYITSDCNELFKALGGLPFRGIKRENMKKKHHQILCKHGFGPDDSIEIDDEQKDLDFIIRYMRDICFNNGAGYDRKADLYKELIAIKPGAHEIYMELFNEQEHSYCSQKSTKSKYNVLKMMHNVSKRNYNINVDQVNSEIKVPSYLTYATCYITEGPFIFRKNLSVSYYKDLKEIKESDSKSSFRSKFHYLDYYREKEKLSNGQALSSLLESAKKFKTYL
jgi:hypothetical protein